MAILTRVLNDKKAGWEKKLLALMGLARMATAESLSALEAYLKNADPRLARCARLAYEEALVGAGMRAGNDRRGS